MTRKRSSPDVDETIRLYLSGIGPTEIARKLGVARGTIHTRLYRNGVNLRDRSTAGKAFMARKSAAQRRKSAAKGLAAMSDGYTPEQSVPGLRSMHSKESRRKAALSRKGISRSENDRILFERLQVMGYLFVEELPVDSYNCDLALFPLAVEVFGSDWYGHSAKLPRLVAKLHKLGDLGWSVLMIRCKGHSPSAEAAEYVVSYLEQLRRKKAPARSYRVIRGDGRLVSKGSLKSDDLASEVTSGRRL